ncbi:MAG: LysM peptidoglycan-binding domain-containing protein [Thermaurantimonas sp.]
MLSIISFQAFAQESFKFHRVQQGETVFSISRQYNISVEDFYKFNPETRQGIKAGDVVMVPASASPKEETIDTNRFHVFTIQEGQTLYSLSRQFNVPIDLIEANNPDIKDKVIRPGMRLLIPKNPKLAPVQSPELVAEESAPLGFHRVKPGESLFSIARIYQISVADLLAFNQISDSLIKPGQLLRVTPPSENGQSASTASPSKNGSRTDSVRFTMHRVEEGETLSALARKYGIKIDDIERYNPELRQMPLKVGMLLLIPIKIPGNGSPSIVEIKDSIVPEVADASSVEYVNYFGLLGKRRLRISLILPVNIESEVRDLRPSDIVAMDYYLGVRTALENLTAQGYQFTLSVIELPESTTDLKGLFSRVRESDIVIGPFVPQQAKSFLENFPDAGKVPVILPFGTLNSSAEGSIWMQESEELEMRSLAIAIQSHYSNQPVYLVYSEKEAKANQLNDLLRKYLTNKTIREIRLASGLQGLNAVTDVVEAKVVVFFAEDNYLSSQFIDRMRRNKANTLIISRRVLDNPLLEPRYLNQINFLIASPRFVNYNHPLVQTAAETIALQHKLEASEITLYAYQTTYDLVKSLTDSRYKPEFIQIKSTRRKGVFQNDAVQILTARNYKLVPINSTNAQNQ